MTTGSQAQKHPQPLLILHLRAVVLALGEATSPAWWKTEFMNESGLSFLERLYPRTAFKAAIHAAGKAAAEAHDRAVGRFGAYHLFRLPESLEIELHRMPSNQADDFFPILRNALGRPEELVKLLTRICGGGRADIAPGAKMIGSDKELMTIVGLRKTAVTYLTAFTRNKPGFPYFTIEKAGDRG